MKARFSLHTIPQDVIPELDTDKEAERVAIEMSGTSPPTPDPDLENEAFYEHQDVCLQA